MNSLRFRKKSTSTCVRKSVNSSKQKLTWSTEVTESIISITFSSPSNTVLQMKRQLNFVSRSQEQASYLEFSFVSRIKYLIQNSLEVVKFKSTGLLSRTKFSGQIWVLLEQEPSGKQSLISCHSSCLSFYLSQLWPWRAKKEPFKWIIRRLIALIRW